MQREGERGERAREYRCRVKERERRVLKRKR